MAPHAPKNLCFLHALVVASLTALLVPKTASLQTNALRRITHTPEHATSLNPTISGDGRRVVFETTADLAGRDTSTQFRAFAADVSTDPPAYIAVAASRAPAAAVSQDGSRVAFSSADDLTGANADRNPEIFLSDGGALRQLTDTSPADAGARLRDGNRRPSLSDDGRLVAFASNRDLAGANADGNDEIFLLDPHTNTFKQLTDTLAPARHADAKLSGDGSRVAFVRESDAPTRPENSEPRRDLVVYERASDRARAVAVNVARLALTPGRAVSDDGLRVVFSAADSRGASQVFLFDGRNEDAVRQLTRLGTRLSDVPLHPSISGDGSRVAFATRRSVTGGNSDSSVELYLHDIPTDSTTRLTDAPREAAAEVVSSLDDEGASVAFNFPRPLAGPPPDAEFADTSEIFLARPSPRPPFSTDLQIVHAATHGREPSSEKIFAPGQIAHATGANLSLVSRQSARLPGGDFPRNLSGVTVTVNGRPARVYYVSPARVDFQIPAETETGAAEVTVRNHDGYESRAVVSVASAAPGIFTERGDGTGVAVALDALTQQRAPFDPVDAANNPRTLVVFATGVARARTLSVSLGGRDAPVEAVVHSAELPGLDEVHVRLRHSLAGAGAARCVLTADGRESNAATIQFTGTRRPARVTLAPGSAAIGVGRTLRLVAKVFDAEGGEIVDVPVVFTSSDDNVAATDQNGVARGIGAGAATITATITTAAGELSAASRLTVHPLTLVVNEVLADPPDGAAGDANRDGVRGASADEFVEIVNASAIDIDLGGYRIETRNSSGADVVRHTFTSGTILAPGTAAVVFGGAEAAAFNPRDAAFGGALVLAASVGALSLPNGGGAVTLRSPAGDVIEQMTYGDNGSSLEGDRNQSLTRAPDMTGDFTLHLNSTPQSPRAFSPGMKIDGTPFDTTAPIERVEIEPAGATVLTGERQQFSARAFGERGGVLSGVIFRWESRDASVAVVDQNGLTTARAPGSTEIVARARGVTSRPATLTVVPPPPRVVRVEVSPAEAAINRGGTQSFTARAYDREGRVVADAISSWTSSDAAVVVIDDEGRARGVGAGTIMITATTPDGAGGVVSAAARLDVRVPVALNELLADVPPDDPSTLAVEGDANRDGVRRSDEDEFVELLNTSDAPVDLSGLRLSDSTATRFTFPAGTSLAAGRAAIVFGGGSVSANDPAFGGALVFASASLGLNDAGDTLTLRLPAGPNEFSVLTQSYGTAGGPPAPSDQSLTRSPDSSVTISSGSFVPHTAATNAAARAFSPGTRADGTPFASPALSRVDISPADVSLDLGAAQTFAARAYANVGGAEVEVRNVSFAWESSDATKATLAPLAGAHTEATARAAATLKVGARAGGLLAEATLTINPPPPVLTSIEISPESASVTVGGAQQFDAQAFDQFGARMTGVVFEWSSSDRAVATVNPSGLASGLKPGTAEIRAASGGVTSRPATLGVTPPPPRITRLELTPAAALINRGGEQKFAARAFDADGLEVTDARFAWSSSDAAVATVDAEGLARGVGAGHAAVSVTAPDGAGGTTQASAAIEVRLPVVLSEFLADVPPDNSATSAIEGDANRDGLRTSGDDEFVELLNASDAPVDLSGLRLSDATATRFTFPAGTWLAAGRAVVVFGGGSPDAADPAFGGALILKANALSLNDGGDAVSLKLTVGSSEYVVFTQSYGTAGGPPAPADQSLTRAPDASAATTAGGNFTPHLTAADSAGRTFSPGTQADGTPFGSPPLTRIEISPAAATLDIGATQTFNARAFASPDDAEIEIANTSFIWDASDASMASLAPTTGAHTDANAHAAGTLTLRARAGGREATSTLTINPPPPALTSVELTPQSASLAAGESRQFSARALDQYGAPFPAGSLAFTSSDRAVASVVSQSFTPGTADATATINAHGEGTAQLAATATSDGRSVTSAPAPVTVGPPPAVPAAGQVVINEALVAFAASTTQQRADFIELHNTTDRTLDISGLVVSFRASGTSNTPRTVTLPGATGSRTTLIGPRGYFLIANGATTFDVAADFAAANDGLNLNNSVGGVKIEVAGVKLDGLAYQSGGTPPAEVFLGYGESPLFNFSNNAAGSTYDLIRSPDGTDTNNNAADFRRNSATGSVSPRAANP